MDAYERACRKVLKIKKAVLAGKERMEYYEHKRSELWHSAGTVQELKDIFIRMGV